MRRKDVLDVLEQLGLRMLERINPDDPMKGSSTPERRYYAVASILIDVYKLRQQVTGLKGVPLTLTDQLTVRKRRRRDR